MLRRVALLNLALNVGWRAALSAALQPTFSVQIRHAQRVTVFFMGLVIAGCVNGIAIPEPSVTPSAMSTPPLSQPETTSVVLTTIPVTDLITQSWQAYRARFIQSDGRVIDWEANARTVSEGQAYAMLRAVLMDDPGTFAITLDWAERNLQRLEGDRPKDHLWSWLWGQDAAGNWVIQDPNFASDADLDAITALIFAARRWNRPDYLDLARTKLRDLWEYSTVSVNNTRYFLPGPAIAFRPQPTLLKLNPSYLGPASFRLFAQVDPDRNWISLVESSYQVLEASASLSSAGLPSDWVFLNTETGQFSPIPASPTHRTLYSFDAYRVWWRVAQDAVWFNEPRATAFLQRHLGFLKEKWRSQQQIPARIDLTGLPIVPYEATGQYGMLYAAFAITEPQLAEQIYQQKLISTQQNGIWDNEDAYYTQNLVWLGLVTPLELSDSLIQGN